MEDEPAGRLVREQTRVWPGSARKVYFKGCPFKGAMNHLYRIAADK